MKLSWQFIQSGDKKAEQGGADKTIHLSWLQVKC